MESEQFEKLVHLGAYGAYTPTLNMHGKGLLEKSRKNGQKHKIVPKNVHTRWHDNRKSQGQVILKSLLTFLMWSDEMNFGTSNIDLLDRTHRPALTSPYVITHLT